MTNVCILKGRLCREPELSTTASGMSVCRIRLAVPRRDNQSGTDFVTCTNKPMGGRRRSQKRGLRGVNQ